MTEATTTEAKTPKRGVGTVIREQLLAGKTNDEALVAVKAEFPSSSTTKSTVSWYRNEMKKKGEAVPSAADARKKAAADPLD